MDIFVEFFDDVDYEEFSNVKIKRSDKVSNILDFYNKVQKLPFKVRKFSFEIQTKLNECIVDYRDFPVDDQDLMGINYRFLDQGLVSQETYMEFIHNAFKESNFILTSSNSGVWSNHVSEYSPI